MPYLTLFPGKARTQSKQAFDNKQKDLGVVCARRPNDGGCFAQAGCYATFQLTGDLRSTHVALGSRGCRGAIPAQPTGEGEFRVRATRPSICRLLSCS